MNRPPESYVWAREERRLALGTTCLETVGLETEHAAFVSRLLVNSDLRSVHTHDGTRLLASYCGESRSGPIAVRTCG